MPNYRQNQGRSPQRNPINDLNDKLKTIDLTVGNTINPELLKTYAEKYGKIKGMTSTQLRKFYDEVTLLERRININKEDFSTVYPSILMLKSKLAYTAGKETQRLKKDALKGFKEFMGILVDKVDASPEQGKKDFKALKLFFEAVVGYYTFHNKS